MGRVRAFPFEHFRPSAWNTAAGARRTPMQHHIWASAYAEKLAKGQVEVYAIGGTEAPSALAPFCCSSAGSRCMTLLGAEDLWESVEVSAVSPDAEVALSRTVSRADRPFRFGHYPADAAFRAAFGVNAEKRALVVARPFPTRAMPKIALNGSWAKPEDKLSARRRSDLRRMARIASEFGSLTFEVLCPGTDQVEDLVNEAFHVEASNWKGESGTAVSSVGPIAAFYREYARLAAAAGILRICFLRIDKVAVATQLAVECDDAFWLLKIGYVEAYRRCSPGNLLMQHTIAYAARSGLAAYEFLGKEADWTRLWTEDARPVVSMRSYPLSLSGAVAIAGDAVTQIRRRLGRMQAAGAVRAE